MAALDKIFELLDEKPDIVEKHDAIDLPRDQRRDPLRRRLVLLLAAGRGGRGVRAARRRPDRAARADGRAGRRDGRGQVDAGQAGRALLRPDPRARAGRRPRPARRDREARCARSSGSCRRRASCSRARSATTSPSAVPTRPTTRCAKRPRAVGADEFIARLPEGYETEVGERGGHLSAGQRQLVAFARAAVADPRMLILDEATSNVDVHTEARIERGLRRLLAGPHRDRDRPPAVDDPRRRAASS